MKNLILVAVILQLVIIIKEINANGDGDKKYEFGDILEFARGCETVPLYNHYAIYVGKETAVDVGQGDNDIFHRSGLFGCGFGKIADTKTNTHAEIKANYLDGKGVTPGSKDEIKARIEQLKKPENCEIYKPISNNCEHAATHIRYGRPQSHQTGTVAGCFLQAKEPVKSILTKVAKNMMDEIKCENGF